MMAEGHEAGPKLTTIARAANEAEAALMSSRLSEAGIHSVQTLTGRIGVPAFGIREGAASPRDISVDARDADRASEILNEEL